MQKCVFAVAYLTLIDRMMNMSNYLFNLHENTKAKLGRELEKEETGPERAPAVF